MKTKKFTTPRNGIRTSGVPAYYDISCVINLWIENYGIPEYSKVLDSVFEMADAIANGNGVPPESAIETVLKDEGWVLLPTHKKLIAALLK